MSSDLFKEYLAITKCVRDVQIDHYDEFVTRSIKRIIANQKCVKIENKLTLKFNDVWVEKPTITPNQARLNNDTYEGVIRCNILCNDSLKYTVPLGKLPIMVKSSLCILSELEGDTVSASITGECENDDGGYFIIKGKERVLVSQMRAAYNRPFVRAAKPTEKLFTHMVEFRSVKLTRESVLVQAKISDSDEISFSLPYIKSFLPAGAVYKALNLSRNELVTSLDLDETRSSDVGKRVFESILRQYDSVENGLAYIVSSVNQKEVDADYVKTILEKEVCYHVAFPTARNVADFLSLLVRRLVLVKSDQIACDDKYNLANKRMDSCCALLEEAFYALLKQYVRIFVNCTKNRANYDPLTICSSINVITNGLLSRFTTGKWSNSNVSVTGSNSSCAFTRLGVSQVVSRQNYHSFKSHMRRFSIPISTKGKNVFPRHVHASQFSYICPYETPEGETVGIVGNLCMTTKLSRYVPISDIRELIGTLCDVDRVARNRNGATIIVNGEIFGKTSDSIKTFRTLEKLRSDGTIDREISLIFLREPYYEIHVESDAGRFLRPLLRVNRIEKVPQNPVDWNDGILSDSIVFRSPWELEQTVVAMDRVECGERECVYCEINPAISMMGIIAGVIPFSNHSQSPRVAYQSNMGKQAIGVPALSFAGRYDTTLTILDYPQKPLTKCSSVSYLKFDEMCNGCVPIIAIATFSGYNQEDSVVINSSSVDRGLFYAHTYKTITDEERKRGNCDFETVCAPRYELRKREYNYSHIDETTGLIRCKPQLRLKIGDVIVGKTLTKIVKKNSTGNSNSNAGNNPICGKSLNNQRDMITTDVSVVIKDGEEGYLDSVVDTLNSEGSRLIKIRIRIPRIPEIGDKFASSTAQKGTCGMLVPQENMPFANTEHGVIVPDMVISVHAIHSRMTINQLLEMSSNLMGCQGNGKFFDATPVVGDSTKLVDLLTNLDDGSDAVLARKMYSGFTGELVQGKMFLAPSFYQRLKHIVDDKIHSRNGGPLDSLNHQPVAGRSRDGGLKCGEMEKDSLFSHGITSVLTEAMFAKSDKYKTYVCKSCGDFAATSTACRCEPMVKNGGQVRKMQIPYATKLLFQYMNGMGIKTVIS